MALRMDLGDGLLIWLIGNDETEDNVFILDQNEGDGYNIEEITIGGDTERKWEFKSLSDALSAFAELIRHA